MKTIKWMLLGSALGLFASVGFSCGGPVKQCGPKDCPFGCCDASGTCQIGSSDAQCGTQGNTCTACGLAQRCSLGQCVSLGGNGGGGGSSTGGGGGSTGGGGGSTGGGGGSTGGGGGSTGGGGGTIGGGGGSIGGGGGAFGGGGGAFGGGGGAFGGGGGAFGGGGGAFGGGGGAFGGGGGAFGGGGGAFGGGGGAFGGGGGAFGGGGGAFGGGGGSSCGPTNCAGCCSQGVCVDVPNNDNDTTCGQGGATCSNCANLGQACNPATLACAPSPTPAETCTSAAPLISAGTYVGTTANATNDYGWVDNAPCQGTSAAGGGGRDVVYRVNVPANTTMRVVLTPDPLAPWDATLNLINALNGSCGGITTSATCLAGADDPENITWTNTSSSSVSVYILVDAYSTEFGRFILDVSFVAAP